MKEKLSRRKFLGGAAATAAGAGTLSGTAAATAKATPVVAPNEVYIRDAPGTDQTVIRTTADDVGMFVEDGPFYEDGYDWWLYRVNGDENNWGKIRGYEIGAVTAETNFAYPTSGEVTSTYWDCRDNCNRYHRACDIANGKGTPIVASRSGTVSHAGRVSGYGYMIDIDHGNGWVTRYAHLSSIECSEGQYVGRYSKIGEMGTTGSSTGDHLHFEIRENGFKHDWPMVDGSRIWMYSGVPKNWF